MTGAYSRNKGGVYVIARIDRCDRYYIGSSVDVYRRWNQHRCDLRKGRHHSAALQNAWNKHGESAFEFAVVEAVTDKANLLAREQEWIGRHHPEYNVCAVAGNCLGVRHGPMRSGHREKISNALRGRMFSEEHRRNIAKAAKGHKRGVGRVVGEATRAKLSAAASGKKQGDDQIRKRVEKNTGQKRTPETRAKMAESARQIWEKRRRAAA